MPTDDRAAAREILRRFADVGYDYPVEADVEAILARHRDERIAELERENERLLSVLDEWINGAEAMGEKYTASRLALAESMRERAAQKAHELLMPGVGEAIRALPLGWFGLRTESAIQPVETGQLVLVRRE